MKKFVPVLGFLQVILAVLAAAVGLVLVRLALEEWVGFTTLEAKIAIGFLVLGILIGAKVERWLQRR